MKKDFKEQLEESIQNLETEGFVIDPEVENLIKGLITEESLKNPASIFRALGVPFDEKTLKALEPKAPIKPFEFGDW